jgi:quercetin dioxygenase-like cupin family protein
MKNVVLIALCLVVSLIGLVSAINAQSTAVPATAEQEKNKLKIVAVNTHDLESFPYDAGSVKFIVSSDDTGGAWSLVEIIEMPGYHTNLHRHNHTSEAFYVLEGVLTVRINDKTVEYPAGSYVLIPPGTPHAQGNRGTVPAKLLLTMTPAGFEVSFKDRAELLKKMKPSDPDFRKKRQENAAKGNYDVEFLENWDLKK